MCTHVDVMVTYGYLSASCQSDGRLPSRVQSLVIVVNGPTGVRCAPSSGVAGSKLASNGESKLNVSLHQWPTPVSLASTAQTANIPYHDPVMMFAIMFMFPMRGPHRMLVSRGVPSPAQRASRHMQLARVQTSCTAASCR